MSQKQETKVSEWDSELPRNNRFEDWPLDTRVSISPELKEQFAGVPRLACPPEAREEP